MTVKIFIGSLIAVLFCARALAAQEDDLRLAVPAVLEETGFMQFLTPRFSLKTSVRITRVAENEDAQMRIGGEGTPVFEGEGQIWSFAHDDDPRAIRFLDWMKSDIGIRTIESFVAADGSGFNAALEAAAVEEQTVFDGDIVLGETVSLSKCGRCHVVNDKNRMQGMGSTPSFALLRTFGDWETRFATFHMLKPHPSFTQVTGVSPPFDPALPPPIVPITMTLDELDAILAYVAGIEPADLGAPLQFQ